MRVCGSAVAVGKEMRVGGLRALTGAAEDDFVRAAPPPPHEQHEGVVVLGRLLLHVPRRSPKCNRTGF